METKLTKLLTLLSLAALVAVVVPTKADAWCCRGGGPRVGVGINFGYPAYGYYPAPYYPAYYPPAYPAYSYYPPAVPTSAPMTYVDQDSINPTASGYCREFTQQIKVDGGVQQGHGTACRQPDGTWKVVSQD